MMRKFYSLFTVTALTLTAGLMGCVSEDDLDPFDTLTTTSLGGDTTGGDGDGDGDATGDGDGDPTTTAGDGDPSGDGDGDAACGGIGDACCAGDVCDAGLSCSAGTCTLGGGDGDGDATGDGDGDPGACDPNNGYCLDNGCMETMGQALVLDTNMDGMNDLGWCLYTCMSDADCPAANGESQASCQQWNMDGDMACFQLCTPGVTDCGPGGTCFDLGGGAGVCTYDAAGF